MKQQINVLIIGSQASMWYNGMIGQQLTVTDNQDLDHYQVNPKQIVFKCDVKVIR